MKSIVKHIIPGILAVILASCDPPTVALIDTEKPAEQPEPKIKVYVSKVGDTAAKQDYGAFVTVNCGEQYIVSASCNRKDLTLELYSSDETIATFEPFGKDAWIVTARYPGVTDLQAYVVDDGQEYVSSHEFVVYGEITLQAECSPVFCKAGFSVVDNPYGKVTADVHIDLGLVGWPYNDDQNIIKINAPSYEGRGLDISDGESWEMIYDFNETSEKMYNTWTGGLIGSGDYYCPHGAVINYVFMLDNPYITIKMLDDKDAERNWQFYISAIVKTEGVILYD